MGLRVLIGRKQAVVSTNDMSGDGVTALAERAVAMARVAPEDKYAGLADQSLLAKNFPDLDLVDRALPDIGALEAMARRAEEAGRAVKGVSKSGGASAAAGIGGMVLLTSHGFSGAYLGSRHSISMQAIAGEGTGMETDYDFSSALHASDLDAPEKIGQSAGEKAVAQAQSAQGLDQEGAGGVRRPRRRLDRRPSGQRHQRRVHRAQDELPQGQAGRTDFCVGHQHHRRSAAPPRPALAAVRRRRRCRLAHGADRRRRAEDLAARQRDRARTRTRDHRTCRPQRLVDAVAGTDQPASRAGPAQSRRADQGYRRGLLRDRPDRLGRQHGDRRLQPRRRRASGSRRASAPIR